MQQRSIVEDIKNRILADKSGRTYVDLIKSLNLVSERIFARSTHFILELIQNAEDARNEQVDKGELRIYVSKNRVKVVHNGHPFTTQDVDSLCGIRTTKKPEEGTLGYLGIGFKSVFKVTDCPQVYSGGFQFKFARDSWHNPEEVPWQITPRWVDVPPEQVDPDWTTFVLPLRDEAVLSEVTSELEKLNIKLYLFLRWLKKLVVHDEVSGQVHTLENLGERDGIVTLRREGFRQAFKFFRSGPIIVPNDVAKDRDTIAFDRGNVKSREVVAAFPVDEEGNLMPIEAGATYGGVYSFLPLGEERTGAKFLIQADFLVQPGREAINCEAKWNHWLVEGIARLCTEKAIPAFKEDERWQRQFLPVFQFTRFGGQSSFDRLFGPKLVDPLEQFFREDRCVLTANGEWVKASEAVVPDAKAGALISEDDLPVLFGEGCKYIASNFNSGALPVHKLSMHPGELLSESLLVKKSKEETAHEWFRRLYLLLAEENLSKYMLDRYVRGQPIILIEGRNVVRASEAVLAVLDPDVEAIFGEVRKPEETQYLHPAILAGTSESERERIISFLRFLGVKTLDYVTIVEEDVLPKICSDVVAPPKEVLLELTKLIKKAFDKGLRLFREVHVVTQGDSIKPARQVFFSSKYNPKWDWESNSQYVPTLDFLSEEYLGSDVHAGDTQSWYEFFRSVGVKDDNPDGIVREFAERYSLSKDIRERFGVEEPKPVGEHKVGAPGYDFEIERKGEPPIGIEVKGLTADRDVELPSNETETAKEYGDRYYLYIVSSIPKNPELHILRDPFELGRTDKLTITQATWKKYRVSA